MVLGLSGHFYRYEQHSNHAKVRWGGLRAIRREADNTQTLLRIHKVVQIFQGRARPKSRLGKACSYLIG